MIIGCFIFHLDTAGEIYIENMNQRGGDERKEKRKDKNEEKKEEGLRICTN